MDEKHVDKVDTREVDTAAQLVAGTELTLDKDEAKRIRCVCTYFNVVRN